MTRRSFREIGVSLIRLPKRDAFQASTRCTELVRNGRVDEAIELMNAASKSARYQSLMSQVIDGRLTNRAPAFSMQLDFFLRARELVDLNLTDEIKYQVALAYNAVESLDEEAIVKVGVRTRELLPISLNLAAPRRRPYISKKRGHHFFYSLSMAQAHVAIYLKSIDELLTLIRGVEVLFIEQTLPKMDQGFGYGGTNAVKLLGIGAVIAALRGDFDEKGRLVKIMMRMMELIFTRKVGPIDFKQFFRACAQVDAVDRFTDCDSISAQRLMGDLLRLKNPGSRDFCIHNFIAMTLQSEV